MKARQAPLSQAGNATRWKAILKLLSGSGLAVVISLLVAPLLTRLFSPESFGWLGWGTAACALLVPLATGTLEQGIIAAEDEQHAAQLVLAIQGLALRVSFAVGIVAVALALGDLIPSALAAYVPSALLLNAQCVPVYFWANRQARYSTIALGRIAQSIAVAATGITLGSTIDATHGLLWANVAGLLVWWLWLRKDRPRGVTPAPLWRTLQPELNYARWTMPSTWVSTLTSQMPLWALSWFHGSAAAGTWVLAQRITSTPSSLIGSSVSDVFRQRASAELRLHGTCESTIRTQAKELLLIAAPGTIVLAAFGPALFAMIFGPNWHTAGTYAATTAAVFFCHLTISPLTGMLLLRRRQRLGFIYNAALFSGAAFSFLAGWAGGDPPAILLAWSLGLSLIYVCYMHTAFRLAQPIPR